MIRIATCVLMIILCKWAWAQERIGGLVYRPVPQKEHTIAQQLSKTTDLSLPFFEDFTDASTYPNNTRWVGNAQVYVNNTMPASVRSRGVATFDALNALGLPYDTLTPMSVRYGDTLTSLAIDLATLAPADSVYLSFLLQPQGFGFYPEPQDSFMVYFKRQDGAWVKVWSKPGSTMQGFTTVMIAVPSNQFFHDNFQFRFVNKISINSNDDVWNLDYIKLNSGRNINDTVMNDIAYTTQPTNLLNDLTAMPYRQYLATASAQRAAYLTTYVQNNANTAATIIGNFKATGLPQNNVLHTAATGSTSIPANGIMTVSTPTYSATLPMAGWYDKVVFRNQFYFQTTSANSSTANDTILHDQVFDNYLAYDDGTAEKSYYLNLFPTLPGKIAIEFSLPLPDTLRGVAIYFGRQSPLARQKEFFIQVYKSIAYGGNTEQKIYEQTGLKPLYDSVDHYWFYKLNEPVPLPAGTFFIGTMQPAFSGSDSLYFGLDANRVGGNHVYYNVLNQWESSSVSGAVMMRPLLGKDVHPNSVSGPTHLATDITLYPNPANHRVSIKGLKGNEQITLYNSTGQKLQPPIQSNNIDLSGLTVGVYYIVIEQENHRLILPFTKQ